ncbi:MAG: S1C family serine protease [Phycisphaerae bacterium]
MTARSDLTSDEKSTIEVFRKAAPSVCFITNIEHQRLLFSLNELLIPKGTGSGFVYDADGHIVTNYHVIHGADVIEVTLANGSQWPAQLVGYELDKDLAVLKIDAKPEQLKPIPLGTSHDLQVGQKVLAIGNPFGLDHTLTVGVVSAIGREIESVNGRRIRQVIQTDAAINPGNSGGPLLDSSGRLIGVNTQITSPSGASAGIGFAVPVATVNEIVPDLIRYGRVRRLDLGVRLESDAVTRSLGLPGPLVGDVYKGLGAAKAGLRGTTVDRWGRIRQLGDVIVAIGDVRITTNNEYKDALEKYDEGDKVAVSFVRHDKIITKKIQLGFIR